jgi:hypothetical protein
MTCEEQSMATSLCLSMSTFNSSCGGGVPDREKTHRVSQMGLTQMNVIIDAGISCYGRISCYGMLPTVAYTIYSTHNLLSVTGPASQCIMLGWVTPS